jgi:hypothetical protein
MVVAYAEEPRASRRLSRLAVHDGNGFYLDEPFGTDQSFDHHKRTYRWVFSIHKLVPHLQNLRDKGGIDGLHTEIIQLHNIPEAAASRFYRRLYVAEDLLGLREKVLLANQIPGFVEGDLSRDIDQLPTSDFCYLRVSRCRNKQRFGIE